MKRVLLLLMLVAATGAFALLKFMSNGLLTLSPEGGVYSVFNNGCQTVYDAPPFLSPAADSERWDYTGSADAQLKLLDAKVLKTEQLDGVTVIYAHTSRLPKTVTLSCGKVNLMAAVSCNKVALGYPYLDGSY